MIGLVVVAAGALCGIGGFLLLRRTGPGWRIGRLLSAAPRRTLAEVGALASAGEPAYVRIHGRIDSEEEFTGDGDKPVVFRRRRLQRQVGTSLGGGVSWRTFDDERLAVPFALVERGDRVEIDTDALGDGLVVVPRESVGTAADLDEASMRSAPPDLSPETPVRLRIEQVSSVDHATAAGVPTRDEAGAISLGAGLGRPLILTTLDPDEAMRVLASPQRRSLLVASGLLVAAPIVVLAGLVIALVGV